MATRKKPQPKPNSTASGELACAFGEPWLGPHPLCQAETARICGVPITEVLLPDFSRYRADAPDEPSVDDFQLTPG